MLSHYFVLFSDPLRITLYLIKAPSTLIRFQTKTELFCSGYGIVHTTTPKTITENGAIRKRSPEWSDLKTMLFENAVF